MADVGCVLLQIAGRWETEIIREPSIIAAYVRQRQLIEEEKTEADDLLPSDDEGKNERARKRLKEQLEKLKRNQERRLARKNEKLGIKAGAMGVGGKRAVKTETVSYHLSSGGRWLLLTSSDVSDPYLRQLRSAWTHEDVQEAMSPLARVQCRMSFGPIQAHLLTTVYVAQVSRTFRRVAYWLWRWIGFAVHGSCACASRSCAETCQQTESKREAGGGRETCGGGSSGSSCRGPGFEWPSGKYTCCYVSC